MPVSAEDFSREIYTDAEKYGDVSLPYRLFFPVNYDPGKKYPLVIFLHGVGERGDDNEIQITFDQTPPVLLISEANLEKYPCFILAPQCPGDKRWVEAPWETGSYVQDDVPISIPAAMLVDVIDILCKKYSIDNKRLYLTGLSMGGFGTWDLITRFPEKFAAAAPVCGVSDASKAALIKDLPIWAFHGDKDDVVPVKGTREMVESLKRCGSTTIKYTEYAGVDHISWNKAYTTEGFFDWMFSQKK